MENLGSFQFLGSVYHYNEMKFEMETFDRFIIPPKKLYKFVKRNKNEMDGD